LLFLVEQKRFARKQIGYVFVQCSNENLYLTSLMDNKQQSK